MRKRDGERRPLFEVRGQTYTQSDLKETPHREITPRWIPGSVFHMQAQVFTEKVSCQGLFWKEK